MRAFVVLCCLAVLTGAAEVSCQQRRSVSTPNAALEQAVRVGDEAHLGLRPLDALDAYRKILEVQPDAYPALWRASREAVALGELASDETARNRWFERAVEYASRAARAQPNLVDGHAWHAMSSWKQIERRGAADRARRSAEVLRSADRALELDPSHPLAHLVLGEWNADVMRLSAISRWTIRRLVTEDVLARASWESAEDHLRLAVEVAPQWLAAHFALGRMLLDSGDPAGGRDALRQVLERPSVEPVDPALKQAAQELLGRN